MVIDINAIRDTLTPASKKLWDNIDVVIGDFLSENKSEVSLNQIAVLKQRRMLEVKCGSLAASIQRSKDPDKIRKLKLEYAKYDSEYKKLDKAVDKELEARLNNRITQALNKAKKNTKKTG